MAVEVQESDIAATYTTPTAIAAFISGVKEVGEGFKQMGQDISEVVKAVGEALEKMDEPKTRESTKLEKFISKNVDQNELDELTDAFGNSIAESTLEHTLTGLPSFKDKNEGGWKKSKKFRGLEYNVHRSHKDSVTYYKNKNAQTKTVHQSNVYDKDAPVFE